MITLAMPFYKNSGMLALQYQTWAAWPDQLKAAFRIIIVDDGSPDPAIDVERPDGLPELEIYEVLEDRPWHQHAARNLAAHVAPDGWMLLTDMDHVLTSGNVDALVKRIDKLDPAAIYMLNRVEADTGKQTTNDKGFPKPHPNSFVLTRELYWRIGGYDEDFCGLYGTDALFKARAFSIGRRDYLKKVALTRYWRDLVPDASTNAPRKEGRIPGQREAVIEAKKARGEADKITVLNFPWERAL